MRKPKKGIYEHFCVLIFAQGTWNEQDRKEIHKPLQDRHNRTSDNPYHFFLKLTHRESMPIYAECKFCRPIYEIFEELKGSNDGILFQGHHYLILEEDIADMIDLTNLLLLNKKIKKFYMLYLDNFKEIKTTVLNSMNLHDLKDIVIVKKSTYREFIKCLEEYNFKSRILYEVVKDIY